MVSAALLSVVLEMHTTLTSRRGNLKKMYHVCSCSCCNDVCLCMLWCFQSLLNTVTTSKTRSGPCGRPDIVRGRQMSLSGGWETQLQVDSHRSVWSTLAGALEIRIIWPTRIASTYYRTIGTDGMMYLALIVCGLSAKIAIMSKVTSTCNIWTWSLRSKTRCILVPVVEN